MTQHNLLINLTKKNVYVLKTVVKIKMIKYIYGHNKTMKKYVYKVLINVQKENILNMMIH